MTQGPLNYKGPEPPIQNPRRNVWWKVALRILGGLAAGVISCAAGLALAGGTGIPQLFALPPLAVFGGLLYVAIGLRRFGYVTGFVLAPFVIAATFFILLLIICGTGSFK